MGNTNNHNHFRGAVMDEYGIFAIVGRGRSTGFSNDGLHDVVIKRIDPESYDGSCTRASDYNNGGGYYNYGSRAEAIGT